MMLVLFIIRFVINMSSLTTALGEPQMNGCSDDTDFFLTPSVSNMIFISGAALCVFGLVLMLSASIMMSQARNIERKHIKQSATNGVATNALGTSSKGQTELTVADGEMVLHNQVSTIEEQRIDNAPTCPQLTYVLATSQEDQVNGSPTELVPNVIYTDVWKGTSNENATPPAACMPPAVQPYASSPIPSPEVTHHHDQTIQYTGNDVINWYSDPKGSVLLPPPPKSSPPIRSPTGSIDYPINSHGSFGNTQTDVFTESGPQPFYTGEYSAGQIGPEYATTIPQRDPMYSRNDSFTKAIGITNQTPPPCPVSKDGSIQLTYM
jgi:hypothetical protein